MISLSSSAISGFSFNCIPRMYRRLIRHLKRHPSVRVSPTDEEEVTGTSTDDTRNAERHDKSTTAGPSSERMRERGGAETTGCFGKLFSRRPRKTEPADTAKMRGEVSVYINSILRNSLKASAAHTDLSILSSDTHPTYAAAAAAAGFDSSQAARDYAQLPERTPAAPASKESLELLLQELMSRFTPRSRFDGAGVSSSQVDGVPAAELDRDEPDDRFPRSSKGISFAKTEAVKIIPPRGAEQLEDAVITAVQQEPDTVHCSCCNPVFGNLFKRPAVKHSP